MKTKPLFIVMSAPSGCGKSTLIDMLLQEYHDIVYSISCTTRAPRGEERDGVEYYFITARKFRSLIRKDAFIEYEEVYKDRFYGTLKSEVDRIWAKGHVIIFDVDVKGGVNLKKYFGDDAMSVLILPPSMEVLEQRLRGRGTDSEEAIRERLAKAASEIEFATGKFDRDLVNDKLEDTFAESEALVNDFLCG